MGNKATKIDRIGQTYGFLEVIAPAESTPEGRSRWTVRCTFRGCSNTKVVLGHHLQGGQVKSCGCYKRAAIGDRARKHGDRPKEWKTPEYRIWHAIKRRCMNPNHTDWKSYGGRGITVCERWQDYNAFIADVGRRPSKELQLDRINNNLGYEPGNVRWTTAKENCRNRRDNLLLTYRGVTASIPEWAERMHLRYTILSTRIRDGWTTERALEQPVKKGTKPYISP